MQSFLKLHDYQGVLFFVHSLESSFFAKEPIADLQASFKCSHTDGLLVNKYCH